MVGVNVGDCSKWHKLTRSVRSNCEGKIMNKKTLNKELTTVGLNVGLRVGFRVGDTPVGVSVGDSVGDYVQQRMHHVSRL